MKPYSTLKNKINTIYNKDIQNTNLLKTVSGEPAKENDIYFNKSGQEIVLFDKKIMNYTAHQTSHIFTGLPDAYLDSLHLYCFFETSPGYSTTNSDEWVTTFTHAWENYTIGAEDTKKLQISIYGVLYVINASGYDDFRIAPVYATIKIKSTNPRIFASLMRDNI